MNAKGYVNETDLLKQINTKNSYCNKQNKNRKQKKIANSPNRNAFLLTDHNQPKAINPKSQIASKAKKYKAPLMISHQSKNSNVFSCANIIHKPHLIQWSFITKLNYSKTTEPLLIQEESKLSQKNITIISSSQDNYPLSPPLSSTAIPRTETKSKRRRKYIITKQSYEVDYDDSSKMMNTTVASKRKQQQYSKTKTISSFRINSSDAFNIVNRKEFLIKHQKIPYLRDFNLSSMSIYSQAPTITTYNNDMSSSMRLKDQLEQMNNKGNSIIKKKVIKEEKRKGLFIQKEKEKDNILVINSNKDKIAELSTIETGKNYTNKNNMQTIGRLFSKHTNTVNGVNINKEDPIINKTKIKAKEKTAVKAYNEYEYDYEFKVLNVHNNAKTRIRSISPNKQMLSFLFKDKIKVNHHNRSVSFMPKTLNQSEIVPPSNMKNVNSCLMYTNNTQLTYKATPQSQQPFLLRVNDNQHKHLQYEICHNKSITFFNTKISIDIPSLPLFDDLMSSEGNFSIENSHQDSMSSLIHITPINIQSVPKLINQLNAPISSVASSSFSLSIKPPHKTHGNSSNDNKKTIANDQKQEKEIEMNLNRLKPIETGTSFNDSLEKMNIDIEEKDSFALKPQPQFSNCIKSQFNSNSSKKKKCLSIEQILTEVKNIITEQYKTISSYDLDDSNESMINYLFHLNSQNISYIKKLLSVETVMPKGNMQRLTILKQNSVLQEVLMNELGDIKTKDEKANNINLIIELISNSNLIITELLKNYNPNTNQPIN